MSRARLALLLALLLPAAALAESEPLKLARYHFEYGKYEEAIRLVDELLASKQLDDGPQLVEAWRIHGLSSFYLGNRTEARSSFVKLLSIDPDHRLDPLLVPPLAVVEFDAVKGENEALLAPIRERRRAIAEQKRLEETARRRLLEEEERKRREKESCGPTLVQRVEKRSFLVNFIPFGAPQFEQGRPKAGAIIATAQGVLLTGSIVTYARYLGYVDSDSRRIRQERDLTAANGWRIANWVSAGSALLFYGAGVWDAVRHHRPESVRYVTPPADAVQPRLPSPPKPKASLFLAPTPDGATVGVASAF